MAESVFKWVKEGTWMVGVNTAGKIDTEIWDAFVEDLSDPEVSYYIGCAIGILEVSSAQRKEAAAVLRSNDLAVAVITDEVLVRGIVTATSWLGANVKSFAWKDFDRAILRFDLGEHEERIMAAVERLREECVTEAQEQRRRRRDP